MKPVYFETSVKPIFIPNCQAKVYTTVFEPVFKTVFKTDFKPVFTLVFKSDLKSVYKPV